VERAQARDPSAFSELVCRHEHHLRRLVARFAASTSDQDDIMQNALLNAWRYLPEFQGRSKFSSWMYRVTANTALMFLRGDRRKQESSFASADEMARALEAKTGEEPHCPATSCWVQRPDEALQSAELRALLQPLVGKLNPRLRQAFLLRYVDGLSIEETASALGLKRNATKTRIHRACQALREEIHRRAADLAVCRGRKRSATNERESS
jgi:RNA polymerase sigma-70 factor (ECF subfamily)